MTRPEGFVLVISPDPADATTTLFFGSRLRLDDAALRVVRYDRHDYVPLLAAASAIILVRGLFEFADITRCGHALRTPIYYFLDDNFMVLKEQGGDQAAFVGSYHRANVATALRGFAGVLLAGSALISYFTEHQLHPRLQLYPPIADAEAGALRPVPDSTALHLGFLGGRHLHQIFLRTMVPAIRRLAGVRPVTLTVFGIETTIEPGHGLSVIQRPYDPSYLRAVDTLRREAVHMLLHPALPGGQNNIYKNPHALITAHAIGAVPIVSNAPPYDAVRADGVAMLCDDTEQSWYEQLLRAATDPAELTAIRMRLAGFCDAHFDGTANRRVLQEIGRAHPSPSRAWLPVRSLVAGGCVTLGRAGRAASRWSRGVAPDSRPS